MGLCESMRGWRWRGSAGGLGTLVGVMLLGLCLAQSVPPKTVCAANVALQNLPQPEYQDTGDKGEGFMASFVQSFLHTVQPNTFPKELILRIANNVERVLSDQDLIKDALVYEVGFLVCAAIGVLYIVLMPIVGLFLACCRCCGNCGGKMYQKQTSSIHCRRRALYWSAFVTTVIILAGNICMFKSNQDLKVSVDNSPVQFNTTIHNINTFLTSVPQQLDYVVRESNKIIEEVTRNLDDIGQQLGTQIQERLQPFMISALHPVRRLNQETKNASVHLDKVNASLVELQSSVDDLQASFTAVRNRINETLSSSDCRGCDNVKPELQALNVDTTITIPSLKEFRSAMDEVIRLNLTSKIREVENYIDSIPHMVVNETRDVVQKSKQELSDIQTQLSQVTSQLPSLSNISGALDRVNVEISKVTPEIERAEQIRWAVCVALCCVVLLVVVCNVLGLLLGPMGLKPKADPTNRSCTSDCGGTFLMMGAGFSFLFSWLFMIAVLVLFLLGGNAYTLVCRPWSNGQLLEFIDTPGLIPGLDQAIGSSNINLTSIYKDCEKNQPLWTALHLNESIDLGEFLNISKYTEEIRQQFENIDITLSAITLLSPEAENQLRSFSSKVQSFDSTAVTQQMNNISRINLNATADKLDDLAEAQNVGIKNDLRKQASDLREIQASIDTTIIPQVENLNSTINGLQSRTEKINGTVGEVLSNVGAAQDFLNTNTAQIVKNESRKFLDCQLGYFISYAEWANLMITQQLGRCWPVAGALNSMETIVCSRVVESLNAFWFSLGWCLIFFIPSIILSIKLAKYYRKMKESDVFVDHIIMNHIPRAQMKIT